MQEQSLRTGRFETPNAAKYVTQLCKHFGHKVPASIEGNRGQVTFAIGAAVMVADDAALTVTLSGSDAEALAQMQQTIDDHLQRFAFREDFSGMTWGAAT
ncbi:DUF2218 domain-containing protein [Paracoccus aurantiacus]|uniref:DUF2218 domain-containing protein n=1 Tax=Paracoccus aurantiacus TaxID=2599412 RepID=A0A5C6RTA1_9RHOB|nr:DUF2218 domain-containing protein [Paracoccus aurantiacus]TXB65686.1 DUF2218 domain-containing protein [Paracoccus aurantiacus]